MTVTKKILTILLAALLVFALAGCSNPGSSNAAVDESEETVSATESPEETESAVTERPEAPTHTDRPEKSQNAPASGEAGYDVGDVLPDFSVPTVGGGTFTLSENLGKPVFINLFATWCGPCVGEMPEINELYLEYADSAVFIVIDIGESETTAQSFGETNGYSLPFAYSEDGLPFGEDYFVEYIPQTFVLGADGTIVQFFGGSSDYNTFKAALEDAQ